MKKKVLSLLLVLLMLMLAGCSTKEESVIDDPVEPVAGGWTINADLPEMNDATFDTARQELTDASYSPLFILGTQVVAGTNYQYFCYENTTDGAPSFKLVTVYQGLGENPEISVINTADFEVTDFTEEQGETSSEEMGGGWSVNNELPNLLSEEENAIFTKALEGLDGVGYTPIAKLASQVVAGTNYAFLATGTAVSPDAATKLYVVNIYNDLEGNASVNNICALA